MAGLFNSYPKACKSNRSGRTRFVEAVPFDGRRPPALHPVIKNQGVVVQSKPKQGHIQLAVAGANQTPGGSGLIGDVSDPTTDERQLMVVTLKGRIVADSVHEGGQGCVVLLLNGKNFNRIGGINRVTPGDLRGLQRFQDCRVHSVRSQRGHGFRVRGEVDCFNDGIAAWSMGHDFQYILTFRVLYGRFSLTGPAGEVSLIATSGVRWARFTK